jgi:hypothetical protein
MRDNKSIELGLIFELDSVRQVNRGVIDAAVARHAAGNWSNRKDALVSHHLDGRSGAEMVVYTQADRRCTFVMSGREYDLSFKDNPLTLSPEHLKYIQEMEAQHEASPTSAQEPPKQEALKVVAGGKDQRQTQQDQPPTQEHAAHVQSL